LVVAAAIALALLSSGGGSAAATSPGSSLSLNGAGVVASLSLIPRQSGIPMSGAPVISFDVHLAPNSSLRIGPADTAAHFLLTRGAGPSPSVSVDGHRPVLLMPHAGWLESGGWRHVEMAGDELSIDGRSLTFPGDAQVAPFQYDLSRGHGTIHALIISRASDTAFLLFHRLAELHARVPAKQYPTGSSVDDRLYYDPGWTSGFYAGALWEAAALEPAGSMFARWALADTIEHFGMEREPTHDVGFMYGQSSLRGYEMLCGRGGGGGTGSRSVCGRLRASVVSAADELVALAATNPVAGTIPTDPGSPEAETIVDSMMNIAILPWASAFTGNSAYSRLATHQATVVARVLVRKNGSTAQSANFDRATGRLISVTTHQGLSNTSTWARGEAWAVYGFAVAASELRSRAFLRVAERVAGYVSSHLPAGGVPRWDYDAPAGAPFDVSAGVITAAGLLHLVAACKQLDGASACSVPDARWTALAQRMLAAAVDRYASARPPLGLLRSQIEDERWGGGCWCNHGELIYGLSYALEELELLHTARP
jgi:hypothetical protein